jgi:hypothetical protein
MFVDRDEIHLFQGDTVKLVYPFGTRRHRSVYVLNTKDPHLQVFLRSPLTDSNRRPPPYHGGALPTELRGRERGV